MTPTPEQEAFVKEQKLGVLATQKKDGSSQLSPVYYTYQEGRIVISITKTRAKYHNIRRNSQVSICIVNPEGRPYITVYGRAEIEDEDIVEGTAAVFKRFNDGPLPDNFEAGLREQQRVLVFISPEKFVP